MTKEVSMDYADRVCRSALWAAYGDAIGFITELASPAILKKRTGMARIEHLIPWVRRIGGQFGDDIKLPVGCYSDDTQLRLATSRAIRGNGEFDVEAFANVELPVWNAYSLGGGVGTKLAAEELSKPGVQWCSNFYGTKKQLYVNGGGNGAAMRVQPHVWSAPSNAPVENLLKDVIRNAVVTHGHPRAIAGAVFHCLCVHRALARSEVPGVSDWKSFIDTVKEIPTLIRSDSDLATIWLPLWERQAGQSIDRVFTTTAQELKDDIELAVGIGGGVAIDASGRRYVDIVEKLGCFKKESVGSGTKTAILASILALGFERTPHNAMVVAANALGSDTDTIASMAGAILGCVAECDPPEDVADRQYLVNESRRLASISSGQAENTFRYPDLLFWKAPKRQLDVVGVKDSLWLVAGLGRAKPVAGAQDKETANKSGVVWKWFELYFGQHILLRHRKNPDAMAKESLPLFGDEHKVNTSRSSMNDVTNESRKRGAGIPNGGGRHSPASVNDAADDVIRSGFDAKVIGAWIVRFADESSGVDKAIAFAAIVSKARNARTRKSEFKTRS